MTTVVTEDTTLTAYFELIEKKSVLVKVYASEGGNVGEGFVEYVSNIISGNSITCIAKADDDYTFVEWRDETGKVISTQAEMTTVVTEDTTLTAYFELSEKNSIMVNVVANEGGTVGDDNWTVGYSVSMFSGESINCAAKAKKNMKFVEWRDELGMVISTQAEMSTVVTEDITLTAYFDLDIEQLLEYDKTTGDVEVESWSYDYGHLEVCLIAHPKEGYLFEKYVISQYNYDDELYTREGIRPLINLFIDDDMCKVEAIFSDNLVQLKGVEVIKTGNANATITYDEYVLPNGYVNLSVIPDSNTYLQSVHKLYGYNSIQIYSGEHSDGGEFTLSNADSFGTLDECEIVICLIEKSKAVVVTSEFNRGEMVVQDVDIVEKGKYIQTWISGISGVNDDRAFDKWTDEDGNVICYQSDLVFYPDRDMTVYGSFVDQPEMDNNFSFYPVRDGTAYEVSLNKDSVGRVDSELTIPSTYVGKPVVGIRDYGFCIRVNGDGYYMPYSQITIPSSIQYIGERAFSSIDAYGVRVVLADDFDFANTQLNSFYSNNNSFQFTMSKFTAESYAKMISNRLVGTPVNIQWVDDTHFTGNVYAHYELGANFICIREFTDTLTFFDLAVIMHETRHFYQQASLGNVEGITSVVVETSAEEKEMWQIPYRPDLGDDYYKYHPLEVDANYFVAETIGLKI